MEEKQKSTSIYINVHSHVYGYRYRYVFSFIHAIKILLCFTFLVLVLATIESSQFVIDRPSKLDRKNGLGTRLKGFTERKCRLFQFLIM